MMLRVLALTMLLAPGLLIAQSPDKNQRDRTKALDAAAATPFFTKKGADAVKRVIAGGQARSADDKSLDSPESKSAQAPQAGQPTQLGQLPQGQIANGPQQAPPAPEPVFSWRLTGMCIAKHRGMALFSADGRSISVSEGGSLDADTKIVSISKSHVAVLFHGKHFDLMPW